MSNSSNCGSRFVDGLSDRDSRTKDFHTDESLGEGMAYLAGNCVLSTAITVASIFGLCLGAIAWDKATKIYKEHKAKKTDISEETDSDK